MPDSRVSDPGPEPKRMTWVKALPIIAVALVFWAVQALFEWFGITGPALIGTAVGLWLSNYLGTLAGVVAGGATALVSGVFGGEVLEVIGLGIAEPIAFFGWLVVGLILLLADPRLFKEDPRAFLWFGASLVGAEIPLIGTIPCIVAATAILLRAQIKRERGAHAAWQVRSTAAQAAARAQLEAEIAERKRAIAAEQAARMQAESPQDDAAYAY